MGHRTDVRRCERERLRTHGRTTKLFLNERLRGALVSPSGTSSLYAAAPQRLWHTAWVI